LATLFSAANKKNRRPLARPPGTKPNSEERQPEGRTHTSRFKRGLFRLQHGGEGGGTYRISVFLFCILLFALILIQQGQCHRWAPVISSEELQLFAQNSILCQFRLDDVQKMVVF
jgi:hypothetical protein